MKIRHLKWPEAAGIIALFAAFLMFLFLPLPDVALHYDLRGNPTRFGNPRTLAFIPISGIILFFFLKWIGSFDQLINYPVKITPENAKVQKELLAKLVRWYGLIILYSTLDIALFSVFVRPGPAMLSGLVILLSFIFLAPLPYYIYKANKYK